MQAEALELELESTRQQHHCELQDILGQKADLEEFLAQMRQHEADLEAGLQAARSRQAAAEEEAMQATSAASQLRARVEELEAEGRVSQSNLKNMRQECTERWVSEQAALGQFNQLQARIASLEQASAAQQEAARQLQARLEAQLSINRQLMSKKEDVEWQLMDALAKLDGSVGQHQAGYAAPPPLKPHPSPSQPTSPPHQPQYPYHHQNHTDHHPEQCIVLAPPVVPSPPSSSAHHTPRGSPTKAAASSCATTTTTTAQPPSSHSAPQPIPILLPAPSAVESGPAALAWTRSHDASPTSTPLPPAKVFPQSANQIGREQRQSHSTLEQIKRSRNPVAASTSYLPPQPSPPFPPQGSNPAYTAPPPPATQPMPSHLPSATNSLHSARAQGALGASSATQSSPDLIHFGPSSPAAPDGATSPFTTPSAFSAPTGALEGALGAPALGPRSSSDSAASPQSPPAGGPPTHAGLGQANQEQSAMEQPWATQHNPSRLTAPPSPGAADHQGGEAAAHSHGSGLRRISAAAATTPPPKRS
ncbi:hypothetical protein DUNSADRAFT_15774 [Dunaliella salina]|nr:hypothetical protein DUNSADRAFT_15774 [Dunaliella salina]|eukprot:KAF5843480.1 hypothetical protein DUNSADRAFT_15774 [Dunaliella salina]